MAQETYEICLDGDGFRIIPVTEDQVRLLLSARWQGLSALLLARAERCAAHPCFSLLFKATTYF